GVRGVDRNLPLDSGYRLEGRGDRTGRHRDEDQIRIGCVSPSAAELGDVVSRLTPEPGEPTADVAPANRDDLHLDPPLSLPLPTPPPGLGLPPRPCCAPIRASSTWSATRRSCGSIASRGTSRARSWPSSSS